MEWIQAEPEWGTEVGEKGREAGSYRTTPAGRGEGG